MGVSLDGNISPNRASAKLKLSSYLKRYGWLTYTKI